MFAFSALQLTKEAGWQIGDQIEMVWDVKNKVLKVKKIKED